MNPDNNLEHLRHSLAHLLAAVVKELFPGSHNAIGPAVDNGFYQDFEMSQKISDADLPRIEKAMKQKLSEWKEFTKKEVSLEEAREIFKDNPYKIELAEEFAGEGKTLTTYTIGGFVDLCKGGHSENPSADIQPDAFKLDRVAGAYWRGDEKNAMLTRIYGLAFDSKDALEKHETQIEEAKKRDHRKIGKELDLFTFSDLVGAGLPLFTPKGTAMRNAIIQKIYSLQKRYGYAEVCIPHITKPDLYKTSGHWDKFGAELFKVQGQETEFVMKPMNCPHHTQIYASAPKSYKDLPVRFTESTMVYRDEQTGELLGLSRVRSITQDDGHAFCTPEQIKVEIENIIEVIREFYTSLDMFKEGDYWVRVSLRDPRNPEKYLGDDAIWQKAESILEDIAKEKGLDYRKAEGEAAFYGPKLDFMFKDAIGREWQLATAQLDFVMPERFGLEYTDKDGAKKTPVMIHRAIAGSLERFLSVIIEHFAGEFPFWLSPVQVKVLAVKEGHAKFAKEVYNTLSAANIRVELDASDEGLGKKVRAAKVGKVPYWIVIGDKEIESQTLTVEHRSGTKESVPAQDITGYFTSLQ